MYTEMFLCIHTCTHTHSVKYIPLRFNGFAAMRFSFARRTGPPPPGTCPQPCLPPEPFASVIPLQPVQGPVPRLGRTCALTHVKRLCIRHCWRPFAYIHSFNAQNSPMS